MPFVKRQMQAIPQAMKHQVPVKLIFELVPNLQQ